MNNQTDKKFYKTLCRKHLNHVGKFRNNFCTEIDIFVSGLYNKSVATYVTTLLTFIRMIYYER